MARGSGRRAALMLAFIAAGFFVVGWRFWDLEVAHGQYYRTLAQADEIREIPVAGARGNIVTANGVVVATSKPVWSLDYYGDGNPMPSAEAERLARYLGTTPAVIDKTVAQQIKTQPGYLPVVVDSRLSASQMTLIDENTFRLPNLRVQATAQRYDPYGSLMGNLIGYLTDGQANQETGAAGLELEYNRYLTGHSSGEYAEVNRQGQLVKVLGTGVAKPGDTVHLTINWGLEKTAYDALGYVMHAMRHADPILTAYAPTARQGGVVAINPNNGDILAMASLPSYNPNKLLPNSPTRSAYYDALMQESSKTGDNPFTIVPVQDPFPPGSTFKPMMAVAALMSHVVTASTEIYDPGYFPLIPSFHSWEYPGHFGWLNIEQAIGLSDDTFFYTLGYKMGIQTMDHWMEKFLLNKPTGIDLPYAVTEPLPSPTLLEKTQGVPWTPGQNLNTVVGQGLDNFTMVTLARADSAIANGGTLYEPHLVSEITSPSGRVVKKFGPVVQGKLDVPASVLNVVHKGMELSAQDPDIAGTGTSGTGYGALAGFPIPVASKTGTAQVNGQSNNAVFLTFGPMPHPRILIMVYVKGGNWGADSGFVARAIYDQYFKVEDPSAKALFDYTYGRDFAWPFGYRRPTAVNP